MTAAGSVGQSPARAVSRRAWVALALLLALGCAIRSYRISEPIGGYHAYNEAWYSIVARNYVAGTLLEPRIYEVGIDFRTPPLYSYLVYFAEPLVGDFVLAARWVSVVSSLVAMVFVFLIANAAWGAPSGLFAASLFGFAPIAVTVGRNAQTDMTYVAFLLGTIYFYLLSREREGLRYAALTGAFFAASFFTKYFAVLLPPTLLVWELLHGHRRWIDRRLAVAFGVFVVLVAPYFVYHLTTSFDVFLEQQFAGAVNVTRFDPSWDTLKRISLNVFFGISPVYCCIFAPAGVYVLWRADTTASLFALGFVAYFALYFLNDNHSYYLLTQLPFLALVAGRALAAIPAGRFSNVLLGLLVVNGAVASVLFLASAKYGWEVIEDLVDAATRRSPNPVILLEQSLADSNGPVFKYYCPGCDLVVKESLPRNAERIDIDYDRSVVVIKDDLRGARDGYEIVSHDSLCINLFGTGVITKRPNRHFFGGATTRVKIQTGVPFGISPCSRTAAKAFRRLPPDAVLSTTRGRIFEVTTDAQGRRSSARRVE